MNTQNIKLVLIDGHALIYRGFHALPELTTSKGELINAAYGFTTIMLKSLEELKPTHIAVCMDRKGETFRHKAFKEYKGKRQKAPKELHQQIPRVKEIVEAFNIPIYAIKGYEADDLIGTISKTCNVPNIIVTGDNDALQLVDNDTQVYSLGRSFKDTRLYNTEKVQEKYDGLNPEQLVDYKGLAGDSSDNIPGVDGVGKKTAIDLLKKFGTVENLYDVIKEEGFAEKNKTEKIIRPKVFQNLLEQEERARLSKKLGTIVTDININFKLKDTELRDYQEQDVIDIFQELEFKNLLNKIPQGKKKKTQKQPSLFDAKKEPFLLANKNTENNAHYKHIDSAKEFKKILPELKKQTLIAIDSETTSLQPTQASLVGISLAWKERHAFFLTNTTEYKEELQKIFANPKIQKVGHNIKYDQIVLERSDFTVEGIAHDTMIAAFIQNAGSRRYKLDDLVLQEFGYRMMSYDDLTGTGRSRKAITDVEPEMLTFYAAEDADFTLRLYKKQLPFFEKEQALFRLFNEIEMPLIQVLKTMEMNGIITEPKVLNDLSALFAKEIIEITKKIYTLAETKEFNIASTQQLSKILFEKLLIPTKNIKKTKTGFSTAASELEKLRNAHPIIPLIEQFRELSKLKNTYVDTLPKLINTHTKRIHTNFNQVGAATGRVSSNDPNLQNIPIRSKWGSEIRKAFVAPKKHVLVSADYSQIDLRVIASIADDEAMIEAFKNDEDIHSATAARIFEKDAEEIEPSERDTAKTINFGVIYGMSAYGLSQALRISREDAHNFISKYFEKHKGVKEYMSSIVEFARANGYVETLTGRRRYLPELTAREHQTQRAGERIAINMPVQGSSADIIKIAMNSLHNEITENNIPMKMLLQIHDELVFEIEESFLEKALPLIKDHMENVERNKILTELAVPLKVNVNYSDNWGALK